ncbi:MAG: 4Fe-4S dicluster domain-containing protein [Polyangiaceae bacterium]|nr:4Fe-4S dicluster domain-containing protein [Polyangiaceae bacterium]
MIPAKAILTDTTRCVGCEECVRACKREYHLGKDAPQRWQSSIDDLSATRYTTLVRRPGQRFVRRQCRHCLEPACVSACIVGALQKRADGPVVYDSDRCIGCRYCMMSCPYGIPRYDWASAVPYVRKCVLCEPRLRAGKQPACTEACTKQATVFGSREDLLQEAHRRIRANPDRYVNRVFGETEVGGTSVLYISDIPLGFLAFTPDLGERPLGTLTWAALSKVPPMILGVGGLMAGVWWVTGRRMKLAAEAAEGRADADAARQGDDSESDNVPSEGPASRATSKEKPE